MTGTEVKVTNDKQAVTGTEVKVTNDKQAVTGDEVKVTSDMRRGKAVCLHQSRLLDPPHPKASHCSLPATCTGVEE